MEGAGFGPVMHWITASVTFTTLQGMPVLKGNSSITLDVD